LSLYQLKGVYKSLGGTPVLQGVELEMGEEYLGVIGRSGVGKTTLLRIMAGLERPDRGRLLFRGREISWDGVGELRRETTMVFQRPVFLRGKVFDNVAFGLRVRGVPEGEVSERVGEALERVRAEDLASRDAGGLSGGEQQRVALARALALRPRALLLDEPTSNLDAGSASIIRQVIKEASNEMAVVVATHDVGWVSRDADRILYLEEGRVGELGPSGLVEAVNRFRDNIFSGVAVERGGVSALEVGGVEICFTQPMAGRCSIHVRPQDIILSKSRVETSARNQFRGTIVSVEGDDRVVHVGVDAGPVFRVQITRRSFQEMGLGIGEEVYISFKASSVVVL